jgi:hypothetical protein
MGKAKYSTPTINLVLWTTTFFSAEALVYYVRWFIPFLADRHSYLVPPDKVPFLWFLVKIGSNIIFLSVSILLLKLFKRYRKTGFLDKDSLRIFDWVTLSCLSLAFLGFVQTICDNFYEVHTEQWTSVWGVSNLLLRSFTRLLVFREPQTMYVLLAAIVWVIRQFVGKALLVKKENELFV